MIDAGFPSFFGCEDGHDPTFWLLLQFVGQTSVMIGMPATPQGWFNRTCKVLAGFPEPVSGGYRFKEPLNTTGGPVEGVFN